MESYYVLRQDDPVIFFKLEDFPSIQKLVNDKLLEEMLGYSCPGCSYCCYGYPLNKKWCERRFKDKSEIKDYLEMTVYKYPKPSIGKIFFIPQEVGYSLEEEEIWTMKDDYNWEIKLDE